MWGYSEKMAIREKDGKSETKAISQWTGVTRGLGGESDRGEQQVIKSGGTGFKEAEKKRV